MTLTTHILIAAAVTKPLAYANPIIVFATAVASHYLSDLIPHWDYQLQSMEDGNDPNHQRWNPKGRSLTHDLLRAAGDGALGTGILFLLTFWAGAFNPGVFLITISGAIFPDVLKAVYHLLKRPRILSWTQRLDHLMHSKIRLGYYPLIGVPLQCIIVIIAILLIR